MFNPMEPHELMLAVARVLREAARAEEPPDEFARSQMLSAHSVARHLAAEQAAAPELLEWLKRRLDPLLADRPDLRERVARARGGPEVGAAVQELLDALPVDAPRRMAVRRVLAELADREVAALAGSG